MEYIFVQSNDFNKIIIPYNDLKFDFANEVSQSYVHFTFSSTIQKQSLADILQHSSSEGLQLDYKETSTPVFSCEICELFTDIFFTEYLQWLLLTFGDYFKLIF